ncbi:hypothetical protein HDU76_012949 [Blyttiomyces sp. JEL0837]|nr:hypothetical protein HDU76_012949 [Blyttiomyces sp. JEL0837]
MTTYPSQPSDRSKVPDLTEPPIESQTRHDQDKPETAKSEKLNHEPINRIYRKVVKSPLSEHNEPGTGTPVMGCVLKFKRSLTPFSNYSITTFASLSTCQIMGEKLHNQDIGAEAPPPNALFSLLPVYSWDCVKCNRPGLKSTALAQTIKFPAALSPPVFVSSHVEPNVEADFRKGPTSGKTASDIVKEIAAKLTKSVNQERRSTTKQKKFKVRELKKFIGQIVNEEKKLLGLQRELARARDLSKQNFLKANLAKQEVKRLNTLYAELTTRLNTLATTMETLIEEAKQNEMARIDEASVIADQIKLLVELEKSEKEKLTEESDSERVNFHHHVSVAESTIFKLKKQAELEKAEKERITEKFDTERVELEKAEKEKLTEEFNAEQVTNNLDAMMEEREDERQRMALEKEELTSNLHITKEACRDLQNDISVLR